MKIPQRPLGDRLDFSVLLAASKSVGPEALRPTYQGRYLHWDKLRRLRPPSGLTHEAWWGLMRVGRQIARKLLPIKDVDGQPFSYCLPDPASEQLHELDKNAAGQILMSDTVVNSSTRDRYIISSLMEEAITSSQLEGAATTQQVAKDMLRTGREPRDRGERMVANNYRVMQEIQTLKSQPLTPAIVIEFQRILTQDAIDDPGGVGRLRRENELIRVADTEGQTLHTPPPAQQLEGRMQAMCDFANDTNPPEFLHPVVRAITLHFWLAYDHPFVDGNGRCARALFYWSMLRSGYWLCQYISISQLIRKAPVRYGRAFLYTETDANDLTYFIFYHLELIRRAIEEMQTYLKRKTAEVQALEHLLQRSVRYNHRQLALLSHALRKPDAIYTIISHQTSHNIAYETARKDLFELERLGLLTARLRGKTYMFSAVADLENKIKTVA